LSNIVSWTWARDGVALVTFRDPSKVNFCSWHAVEHLADALEAARSEHARVVVLASELDGHWLEHAWLTDLEAGFSGRETSGSAKAWFRCIKELNGTDVVTIAAISGDASGGGCELGWACDFRIAEEQAVFCQPEVVLGVGAALGGVSRLRDLIGRTAAAEMILLGRPISARRLYELGGINRVVPSGRATNAALTWAELLARQPPEALAAHKRMLREGDDLLRIAEMVRNDQKVSLDLGPAAVESGRLGEFQRRFDAGDTPRDVYGPTLP
jgi:enoyl-CoA hydratase/carnithine racemase